MAEYNICPVCYNRISVNRLRGADGVDENGDPVPFWTDDPLLTKRGLAGVNYKGTTPCRQLIMKELQGYYNQMEEAMGLEQTNFTEVSKNAPFGRIYIIELRFVIEKILVASGRLLADYFRYDRYGNDTGSTQIDWSDVDRTDGYPSILREKPIRAIYIEELRRGLMLFWRETWPSGGSYFFAHRLITSPDFGHQYYNHTYSGSPSFQADWLWLAPTAPPSNIDLQQSTWGPLIPGINRHECYGSISTDMGNNQLSIKGEAYVKGKSLSNFLFGQSWVDIEFTGVLKTVYLKKDTEYRIRFRLDDFQFDVPYIYNIIQPPIGGRGVSIGYTTGISLSIDPGNLGSIGMGHSKTKTGDNPVQETLDWEPDKWVESEIFTVPETAEYTFKATTYLHCYALVFSDYGHEVEIGIYPEVSFGTLNFDIKGG